MKKTVIEQVEWIFITNFEQDQISRREAAWMEMIKTLARGIDELRDKTDPVKSYESLASKLIPTP
jgi:hypothetical protein